MCRRTHWQLHYVDTDAPMEEWGFCGLAYVFWEPTLEEASYYKLALRHCLASSC